MGMTIDKAQSNLRNIQRYYIKADNETIDFTIDILRKYQKIEQLIDNWTKTEELEWKLREVLDDGKDIF